MRRICGFLAVALLIAAGCSSRSSAKGDITVFAAASLTEAFDDAAGRIATRDPQLHITYDFAGSSTLVQQVEQGAPADVIATADDTTMQQLVDAGLVEQLRIFAKNKLMIIVAAGNPKHITSLRDLARSDLTVVLCDPAVPAGRYALQALQKADTTITPKSLETDVKVAVNRVTAGEADASVVYATDVAAAGSKASGIEIPPQQNVETDYPIAIVKSTTHHDAAAAFVHEVAEGLGRAALNDHGFKT